VLRFVIVYLVPIALAIFSAVDCLLTPRPYVRALPKSLWLVVIVCLYVVGPLLWIIGGRTEEPVRGRRRPQRRITDVRDGLLSGLGEPGTHQARPPARSDFGPSAGSGAGSGRSPVSPTAGSTSGGGATGTGTGWALAPDDDPEFLRKLGEQVRRERKDRPEG
jgi:hypothetical protein